MSSANKPLLLTSKSVVETIHHADSNGTPSAFEVGTVPQSYVL